MGLSSKFIPNKNIGLEVYFKSDVNFCYAINNDNKNSRRHQAVACYSKMRYKIFTKG